MSTELGDFARAALPALARVGFAAPAAGEASVLLCDSSVWAAHVRAATDLLDAGERLRAARFRFEHDRTTYVLAHALWRLALGFCLGVDAAEVPLESTPSGQPSLPGTDFATSLSHSGSWVAIAITAGVTIGVDIECSPSRILLDELLPTICTPIESEEMRQLDGSARETALLTLWTRKEALLKAFGVGLLEPPAQLLATTNDWVTPPDSATVRVPCRVLGLEPRANLVGSLAVPATVVTNHVYWLGSNVPRP